MRLHQIILLTAITFFALSCSEEYVPVTDLTSNETVIIAELEVGVDIDFQVTSTYGPDGATIQPTKAEGDVFVSNPANNQVDIAVRYNENTNNWFSTFFKFSAGQTITLETDFSDIGLGKTSSSVLVPEKGSFTEAAAAYDPSGEDGYFMIDATLDDLVEENYYHIMPYIIDQNNNPSYLDITQVIENSESVFQLSHTDGILIDYSLLQDDKGLVFQAKSKNLSNPNSSVIHLLLKTVPKEYYEFHRSLSVQKETQQGPFDAPVPTFTNIEGGQGIFVAYQTTLESVELR